MSKPKTKLILPGADDFSASVSPIDQFHAPKKLSDDELMAQAFPTLDFGEDPNPHDLVIQVVIPPSISEGGIKLVDESLEYSEMGQSWGKVIDMGDSCYKYRNGEEWCWKRVPKIGDYIRFSLTGMGVTKEWNKRAYYFRLILDENFRTIIRPYEVIPLIRSIHSIHSLRATTSGT